MAAIGTYQSTQTVTPSSIGAATDPHAINGSEHTGAGNIVTTDAADYDAAGSAAAAQAASDPVGSAAAAIAASCQRASNLSDLAAAATARTNLGLGDAATKTVDGASGVCGLDANSRVVLARLVAAPHAISGGAVIHDGTRFVQGFHDPNDSTIEAGWSQEDIHGAGGIAKSSGVTTITVPATDQSDWGGGNYNATRLERDILPFRDWEAWVHTTNDGTTNDQGAAIGVHMTGVDGNYLQTQSVYTGNAYVVNSRRGDAGVASDTGAQAVWLKLAHYGGVAFYAFANAAIGAEPAEGGWTTLGQHEYPTTWMPRSVKLFVCALNFGGFPGCTPEFGRVKFRYL